MLSSDRGIDCVGRLHELASLPEERIEDTQEYQHIYYYNRLAMYYCMYNNNICMYLNILSFDNSITSSITYNTLSMKLKFMISLEIFTWWKTTIVNCKEQIDATRRMEFSSTHQVSFMCSSYIRIYVVTSMYWIYVRPT